MKFVAVTSCPTGIAHTYTAAESLEQGAALLGHEIHIETQGASGSEPLDPALIAAADGVIFAADVEVRGRERFAGKPVVQFSVKAPIADAEGVCIAAVAAAESHSTIADHDAIDRIATTAAVLDNHERDRFDLWVCDELAGVLGYLDERDTGPGVPSDRRIVAFMHTVVAEEWTGKGLGAILVREAFAHARSRNWSVRLVCSYAQHILTETKPLRSDLIGTSTNHMMNGSTDRPVGVLGAV